MGNDENPYLVLIEAIYTYITSCTIHEDTKVIAGDAFNDCRLISIMIPDSVISIGDRAFHNCEDLISVTISDSCTSIGKEAFFRCTSLTEVTIPDSVTSIGDWAFYDCNSLTSITIPDNITSIGAVAFGGCNKLTSFYFEGTMAQWETIEKGNGWSEYIDSYTIYCTDGDIQK